MKVKQAFVFLTLSLYSFVGLAEYISPTSSCVYFRKTTKSRRNAYSCLPAGTELQVLKKTSRYSQVKIGNQVGYVWTKFIDEKPARSSSGSNVSNPATTEKPSNENERITIAGLGEPYTPIVDRDEESTSQPSLRGPTRRLFQDSSSGSDASSLRSESVQTVEGVQAPFCGAGNVDRYKSAVSVGEEGVIKPGKGYNLNANNWSQLQSDGSVEFGPGSQSMCTSATLAGFHKQIGDLIKSGQLNLSQDQIDFLNSNTVKRGFNGNTWGPATILSNMGGAALKATTKSEIKAALKQARPGDIFTYARGRGGHSTIFKGLKGDEACFVSSQKRTGGFAEACLPVSQIKYMAISRLPSNPQLISDGLNQLMGNRRLASKLRSQDSANRLTGDEIKVASLMPECPVNAVAGGSPARRMAAQK